MSQSAGSLWQQGEVASDAGQWSVAEDAYRRSLVLDGRFFPSLIGLSTALSRRDAHREAHAVALSALALRPTQAPMQYVLAQRMRYFHEFAALQDCLGDIRFAKAVPLQVLAKCVVMLSSIGAHAEAIGLADQGLRRDPAHAALLYVRGNLHFFDGELEAAEASYERSLQSDPTLLQVSWMLASVRTQTADSNHIDRLREQLHKARPGQAGEAYVCFALYKEFQDLGEHGAAWTALARGCAVKRKLMDYRLGDDIDLAAALESTCDANVFARTSEVIQPHVPIFIVGMHRSGTTLLERILAAHPDVGDAGETNAFDAQMRLATDHATAAQPDALLVQRSVEADFDKVARDYARQATWLSRGKPKFTEKLPMNFWNIGFIARALPQARILHLVRDPADTCFSNLRTLFAGVAAYSYDQRELAGFYAQYRRMMNHWHEVLPGRVLDVDYRQLVEHPEQVARAVASHCGLSYEPAMIDVQRSSGRVSTASASLARTGIRRDRGRAWEPYASQLEPLLEGLAAFR